MYRNFHTIIYEVEGLLSCRYFIDILKLRLWLLYSINCCWRNALNRQRTKRGCCFRICGRNASLFNLEDPAIDSRDLMRQNVEMVSPAQEIRRYFSPRVSSSTLKTFSLRRAQIKRGKIVTCVS